MVWHYCSKVKDEGRLKRDTGPRRGMREDEPKMRPREEGWQGRGSSGARDEAKCDIVVLQYYSKVRDEGRLKRDMVPRRGMSVPMLRSPYFARSGKRGPGDHRHNMGAGMREDEPKIRKTGRGTSGSRDSGTIDVRDERR